MRTQAICHDGDCNPGKQCRKRRGIPGVVRLSGAANRENATALLPQCPLLLEVGTPEAAPLHNVAADGMYSVIGGESRKNKAQKAAEIAGMSHGIGGKTQENTVVCPLLLGVKRTVVLAVYRLCPMVLGVK